MNRQERRRADKTAGHGAALQEAFTLQQRGALPAAERLYRQILRDAPEQPDAVRLLGELLSDTGNFAEAITLLRRLADAHPAHFASRYSLGNAYRLAGQLEPAIACYHAALALEPGFAGAHHGLGLALRVAERDEEAVASLRQAVRAKPDWAVAWQDLGVALAVLGDLAEAEAALLRAVALAPGLGAANRHLAALRQGPAEPGELTGLRLRAEHPSTPAPERVEMLFTLGRLADKAADYDAAFGYFSQANALLRAAQAKAGLAYNRERMSGDVERLVAAFSANYFSAYADCGDPDEAPVFILGMPRAGSTLFEQIAASHSRVLSAGEHAGIGRIAGTLGALPGPSWQPAAMRAAAARYLEGLRSAAGNADRLIDKMPDNVFQLGLIATLFPNARVIFCVRNLFDTCLSCFFQYFAQPYGFDTDLADCAHRHAEVERLIRHWREVLPLRCLTLDYDACRDDLEGQARQLIGFLGLDWEDACLHFHRTRRPVRTASWSQVRRPFYTESLQRWRHYEPHLEPLRRALAAEQPP